MYGSGPAAMAPGVSAVEVHAAATYETTELRPFAGGNPQAPVAHNADVYNHSYERTTSVAKTADTLRLNHVIDRDEVTVVVATRNTASTDLSDLFAQTHNAIVVGRSDGDHAYGLTDVAGDGRTKPDIVAPLAFTSHATPLVSASAALLIDQARATPALADADNPEVVKAALMAGAVKDPTFAAEWDRTATRPLDAVYGAGQVNIDRSHRIVTAGPQDPAADAADTGWDFASTDADPTLYRFDVPAGQSITELSAVLTWHQTVHDAAAGDPDRFAPAADRLANLDLRLFTLAAGSPDQLLDDSLSTLDNVEHIYFTDGLGPGEYALEVTSDLAGIDYGLAWHSVAIPEPNAATLLVVGLAAGYRRRRRAIGR